MHGLKIGTSGLLCRQYSNIEDINFNDSKEIGKNILKLTEAKYLDLEVISSCDT